MNNTTVASGQQTLTREEIESFAADWYRKLDEHVPAKELVPMLTSDVEFHVPEGVRRGIDAFLELYQGERGWTRSFFDEVHTLSEVSLSWSGERAIVDLVVNWQARRWQPPAPRSQWIGFDAYQQWEIVPSVATGRPAIARYVVNELRPMSGSPRL